MSETTPGVTNIMAQPLGALSPADAQARRDQLAADPEFKSRIDARDPTAFDEAAKLWRVAHGMPPEPLPPATADEVRAAMTDRQLALDDARLSVWEQHVRMTDQMRFEHRRGLATAQQVEDAKRDIEWMKRDGAFRARVLAGDQDAVDKWMRAGRVASMQVAAPDHDWTKP